jgi:hypothetical protein
VPVKNFAMLAVALPFCLVSLLASDTTIAGMPVSPGELCTLTEIYFASAPTVATAIFTDSGGNNSITILGSFIPTSGSNVLFTPPTFLVPANAATVSIVHGVVGNGTLIVTNSQLTCTVSGNGGSGGSGQVIFPSAANPAAPNTITTFYSVVWQNIVPANNNGGTFTFSDTYSDAGPSTIIIVFTAVSGVGGQLRSLLSPTFAAGTNAQASVTFQLPPLVPGTTIQVVHNTDNILDGIVASNPILTESN